MVSLEKEGVKPNFKYSCEYCLHFFASALAIMQSSRKSSLDAKPRMKRLTNSLSDFPPLHSTSAGSFVAATTETYFQPDRKLALAS
ncbi:hypothetical protein T4D_1722 [Trichinella pseudospiralis]|uniref:Uncharacterized protein n=1 Tax=Trichinella pseudospiralis TaxID=6337 RepID=A0A0V1G6G6_TRIPS|nr:hypothetical protein T4D_1722 [Trichinella pseudospiralis]